MTTTLQIGREAVGRHAWSEAVDAFRDADRQVPLEPDDLERLGTAAFWAGAPDEASEALERAFTGYEAGGRNEMAAATALWLAYHAFRRQAGAVGAGWLARARHLLDGLPDSRLHAFFGVIEGQEKLMSGDIEGALERFESAMDVARRRDSPDALYVAMGMKGLGLVMSGSWQQGLAALDEAAAAATAGDLDLRSSSDIFCMTIAACRQLGDLDRAGQWADESERWMRRNGAGGYPGICRVHRAELKMLRGQWPEAEHEALQATNELERFGLLDGVGYAYNAIGEIRLRMGDIDGAADAFDRAYEYGHDAQPGTALLQLARGELDEASRSIERALDAAGGTGTLTDRTARGRLLPAKVEIAIASRALTAAADAVSELEGIAADFERPIYRAGAMTARGELLLGEDRAAEASPILGRSWRMWLTSDLPYEAAKARLHYAEAVAAEGDEATARRDLMAVRGVFERLGAKLDIRRVDELLGGRSPAPVPSSTARVVRTFMFTDIVTSTDLIEIIGDEAWTELLAWHDRELRATAVEHGGDVVSHTGDGFFVAFERPLAGVECAVDIQRRLVRHRREHGFAPFVRIGLHAAEATRHGHDYSGGGVHLAARLGAAAARDEILVSAAVLDGLAVPDLKLSEPRQLRLKGIRQPVEARTVDWRT